MNFGQALEIMKSGRYARRAGWNGKGMYVWLQRGSVTRWKEGKPVLHRGISTALFDERFVRGRDDHTVMPHLCMRAADGSTVPGWLASQTDMLAEDWEVVA